MVALTLTESTAMPAVLDNLPSFEVDPAAWEQRVRAVMDSELRQRKTIKSPFDRVQIVTGAFAKAKAANVFGQLLPTWEYFSQAYVDYVENLVVDPKQELIDYAKSQALRPEQIESVIHRNYPHGYGSPEYRQDVDKIAKQNRTGSLPNTAGAEEAQRKFNEQQRLRQEQHYAGKLEVGDLDTLNDYGAPYESWEPEKFAMSNVPLDPDDLDAHLGREKGVKPAPRRWSALDAKNIVGQVKACQKHFTDELTIIDPKANAGQEIRKALGMELQLHIQKFGVQSTVDKLQAHLTNYGEKTMASKLTPQDWTKWLGDHKWNSKDVIAALNEFSEANSQGAIEKLSQWNSLETAENVMNRWLEAQKPKPPQRPQDDTPPPPLNIIKLDDAAIRLKYTMQLKYFDKKQNKTIYTDYLKVPGRILLFRLDHPIDTGWTIDTDIVSFDADGCVCVARIADPNGHIVAVGHAAARAEGSDRFSGRYLEKAETSALGRALAHAGYGTDEAADEEFADSPTERKTS